MTGLSISSTYKSFGDVQALRGVTFDVAKGEIVAVLGPSGCGKTTLLAVIAGLETPDQGEISWQGKSLTGIPTHERGMGLMFQDLMLFPHRNVYANVAFGLEMLKIEPAVIEKQVGKMLEFVGLRNFKARQIHSLSGGEQQRVALARSLAPNPRLLMLDEPFSSLDRTLRERLILELRKVLRNLNQTALYITHDQEEAFGLADRVVVMNEGEVVQIGTPEAIYSQPICEFVARFLGFKNICQGRRLGNKIQTPMGDFQIPSRTRHRVNKDQEDITFLLRPDQVHIETGGTHQIQGIIQEKSFRGGLTTLVVDTMGNTLKFEFQSGQSLPGSGETVNLFFNSDEAIQILA